MQILRISLNWRTLAGWTTREQVRELRFDPAERGVEALLHTKIERYFFPHRDQSLERLPEGIRTCLDFGPRCQAWLVQQGRKFGKSFLLPLKGLFTILNIVQNPANEIGGCHLFSQGFFEVRYNEGK